MKNFAQSLLALWGQLGINQRVSLVVAALVVTIGIVAVGVWSRRPDYQLLYARLGDKDAASIIGYLESQDGPHQVTAGGTAVQVPADQVYKIRMDLAGIGAVGTSAGMFSLGAQGALKIIAGQAREFPGFQTLAFVISNRAYDGGFKSFKDMGGRSLTVSQIGSGSHYSITLIAEKYGINLNTIRILPLQSIPNQISAVTGGQADGGVVTSTPVMPATERGDLRLLGFVGDVTPWQIGAVFTSTKTDNEKHDMIERFLRAFRKGAQDYHDAFAGPDDKRRDSPTAPDILAIIAKYTGQPVERLKRAIAYIDPGARLDLKDLQHQIDWFRSQNLLKGNPRIEDMIDKRTVVALPTN